MSRIKVLSLRKRVARTMGVRVLDVKINGSSFYHDCANCTIENRSDLISMYPSKRDRIGPLYGMRYIKRACKKNYGWDVIQIAVDRARIQFLYEDEVWIRTGKKAISTVDVVEA